MTRESIRERVAAACDRPWERYTFGTAGLADQTQYVADSLAATEEDAGVPMTDLTWVRADDADGRIRYIALVGNGPKQIEHADFIAHARQDVPLLLAVADAAAALSEVHENTATAVADGVTPLADLLTALAQRAKAWDDVLTALAALEAAP